MSLGNLLCRWHSWIYLLCCCGFGHGMKLVGGLAGISSLLGMIVVGDGEGGASQGELAL